MILPYSTQFTCPVKENGFSSLSLFSTVPASSHCKRNRFEVTSLSYECFGSVKIASSRGNVTRCRRNVKAFGLVDKLGKKLWREEEESDSEDEEDEVKKDTSGKRASEKASLDDPEERREWRKKIREVIDNHPDIEEEEIDLVEKRRKMQKLLADYPLVVNEEDPNWPEDADGWGFSFNQFFDKITIKNEKKDDDDEDDDGVDDSEKEIVWQDDNYIRPIKDLTTAEWEEAVFKDISPLMVLVHNRYKRPKENEKFREELEKAIQVIWNCGLPSPRCVAVDAVVETDLVSALQVSVFPEIIFTKAGKILYREKGIRTADELSKIMAFFYYGAAKPPCLNGVDNSQEQVPSVDNMNEKLRVSEAETSRVLVIEADEREALASLVPSHPPPRKTHSYVEQHEQKPHHPIRKYSLDEGSRSVTADSEPVYFDSSDGEFSTEGVCIVNGRTGGDRGNGEDYGFVTPPSKPASQRGETAGLGGDDVIESLPEVIGAGGGVDVFKVPVRTAVNPGRPPCLELRPHPLRDTQTGKFLRTIACTESQVWAGQENGVRYWNMEEAYEVGYGIGGQVRRGDEDTAPFYESVIISPTLCLMIDHGNRLVWSGHKDGKIKAWKMNQPITNTADDSKPFKERLSWQAHRGPVNHIVMSSYGDMWSCSEGGVIKIWTLDSLDKSLVLKPEEKHMAALLVERSGIDLRSQVTVNGTCSISSSDVKFLLVDTVRAKVWAVQHLSFSLWDAQNKELLKVFNIDGQVENRVDMPASQGQQVEETKAVLCFCTFGDRIYVGYASGYIQILDLGGKLIASWVSHNEPVVKLAAGGPFVFSLATHGGVRGWCVKSPGPLDSVIRTELSRREAAYARQDSVKILVGTWNVGEGRASRGALMSWLGSAVSDVGIVAVGLQEVDMGAGFLAMSTAKETVGVEGSAVGQWWLDAIGNALDERNTFERMGSRQLAGLLISLWVRKDIRSHVGDLDVAAVPCGFGRAIGNKGGVGLRIRVYDRIMCFVNCHLAAHLEAVTRRNADFNHIYRSMVFSKAQSLYTVAAAGASTSAQAQKNNTNTNISAEEEKSDLAAADFVAFFGDFNYRLFGITYDEARDFISHRSFDWLREKDQLRAEMNEGKVFQGMREALITFPPTYKFEKNKPGLGGYDSGEKKRIPAWCDRVIYRDNQTSQFSECSLKCPVVSSTVMYEACMDVTESDHKPVRCKIHANIAHTDKSARRQQMGELVSSSDKLGAMFEELRLVPETSVSTNSILLQSQDTFIFTITNKSNSSRAIFNILCKGQTIARDDGEDPENQSRGTFGLPRWLEVSPGAGMIKPDASVQVKVHHEDFNISDDSIDGTQQNVSCEDTLDKEVTLTINVQGSCSTGTTSHSIKVRHCFSAAKSLTLAYSKPTSMTKNPEGSTRYQTKNPEGSTRYQSKNPEGSTRQQTKNPEGSTRYPTETYRGGSTRRG
ncbi:unnamed protein product, partial [Thlaspi arvense]